MGGFGVTYLAYDKSEERKVAVKEYFPRSISHRNPDSSAVVADDPAAFDSGAEKFCLEAKIVSELKDEPFIVKIYDIIRANNTVYLVMEYLRGKTVKEYVRDCGVLDVPGAVYAAQCILNALSATHGANVLHRDISPDNIILCGSGDVKLIDFGAARRVVEECTQNFSTIVQYGFAPPEQYRRKTEQGAWSDIYSLGATMYYALTGDIPADPMSRFDDDDTFRENNFDIDEGLWGVITKATSLNADKRYQSAAEMREALDKLSLGAKPVTFPDDEPFRHIFKTIGNVRFSAGRSQTGAKNKSFRARHGRAVTIAGGSLAAAAACFSVYFALNSSKPKTSEAASSEAALSEPVLSEVLSSDVSSAPDSDPGPETPPVPLTETFPYFGEYETKAWYLNMDERERELYKIIYDGLSEGREYIEYPAFTYTRQDSNKCYYGCVYDNPWICNVGDYAKTYEDENDNLKLDDNETIYFIEPDYLDFEMDTNAFREEIEKAIGGDGDTIEKLRSVHDTMVEDVAVVARYVNQSCTHAYGSIVHKKADDMGFAQGFCVYAQAMGLPCRVIDGTKDGEVRAWCVVKIDDTWYNVDVYGDLFAHSAVDGTINVDRNAVFHTYFLASDKYFRELGYEPNGGWEGLGGEEFSADSQFDNYYIQSIEEVEEYFSKDAQSAYDRLLQKVSEASQSDGSADTLSLCLAPYLVNDLYDLMDKSFVSDCKEKCGVSISGYTVRYDPVAYSIELKF